MVTGSRSGSARSSEDSLCVAANAVSGTVAVPTSRSSPPPLAACVPVAPPTSRSTPPVAPPRCVPLWCLPTALPERRLEFLPDGRVLLGRGDRGLLHGRTLHLRGAAEAEAPVVAHAGRHLARRAGGAEESVLDQGVAVGDVGG